MRNVSFNSSLRPLFILLRLLGVDLSVGSEVNHSKIRYCSTIVYGMICFLFNLSTQILNLILIISTYTSSYELESDTIVNTLTCAITESMDNISFGVCCFGSHLILLTVVRPQWETLIQLLKQLENELEPQFFINLRRFSILGIILVIFMVNDHLRNYFKNKICYNLF